jgi:hypothetical protein
MKTMPAPKSSWIAVTWLAVALAVVAALAYVMIAAGWLAVGDIVPAQEGGAVIYVAAGSYLVGGLLILAHRRWLWIAGAIMNALVMLFYFQMYQGRLAVLFSPGGLVTKLAQLVLEAALIYLIIADWRQAHRGPG